LQGEVDFTTSGQAVFTDSKYFRNYGWYVSGTIPSHRIMPDSQVSQLGFCINLQRSTNSLRIEMSLPSTVTSTLFLLTPLLGEIHIQIINKMFVLFLQFLTLQLYSTRITPHLGSVAATPKILQFLQFAIIINTLSISVSILLWMCSKIRRNLPPWNWLIRISEVINRCVCVFNFTERTLPSNNKSSTINNYQEDWINAFMALHGIAVCILSLIFIFGYLIIS
uniref:Neur_chan_LBD domain-containing protein n=1 Tax=Thelazia callipaeda TaxID=103827 RepID=A0A0N5DBF7_THECL